MKEVSCRHFSYWFEIMKQCGVSPEAGLRRVPYSVDYLLNPTNRIDWSDYVKYTEDAVAACGIESFRNARVVYGQSGAMAYLRKLSGLFTSPRRIYDITILQHGPSLYTHLHFALHDLPDGRLQIEIRIPEEYEDCPLYFIGSEPAFATLPQLIGLPPAEVVTEVFPRRGVFTVTLPESRSVVHRLRRLVHGMLAPLGMAEFLGTQQAELRQLTRVLQSERDQLHQVIEAFPDGLMIFTETQVLFTNGTLLELLDLNREVAQPAIVDLPISPRDILTGYRFNLASGGTIEVTGQHETSFHEQPACFATFRDVSRNLEVEDMIAAATMRERERLAHDLHDGLGQYFAALNYKTAALAHVAPDCATELEAISMISREASMLARGIVHGLGTGYAEGRNIILSLDQMGKRMARLFNIGFDLSSSHPALTARPGIASDLFALVQESFTNAIRHGACSRIVTKITHSSSGTDLVISDNGSGFNLSAENEPARGMGHETMCLRVRRMGGRLRIDSAPGQGCRIHITLPRRALEIAASAPLPPVISGSHEPAPRGRMRIFHLDDHAIFRHGVRQLVDLEPDLELCGEAADATQLLEKIQTSKADILVLDLLIGGQLGFPNITSIRVAMPQLKILVLTMFSPESHRKQAIEAGADSYVQKSDPPETFLAALRAFQTDAAPAPLQKSFG